MASNPYQTDSNRPLLYNNPPPPPPPPPTQPYNPYTDRNNYNQIPSFTIPNLFPNNPPPYNPNNFNPNLPFNQNPPFNPNPNPSFNPNPYTQPGYRNPGPTYPPQPIQPAPYNVPQVAPAPTLLCANCRRETPNITQRKAGGVTWIWCCVLLLLTGIGFCIPFCVDSCQDQVITCAHCHAIKSQIPANCC